MNLDSINKNYNIYTAKFDEIEKNTIAEYYQRCFGEELPESLANNQI